MRPRRPRSQPVALETRLVLPLTMTLTLLGMLGCESEPVHLPGQAGASNKPAAKKEAPADDPFIVGRTTQKIGRADDPALKQGAEIASSKIVARDPITVQGNAYVVMIGRTAQLNIQHAMDLYHAANDRWPANYDEFMREIIQANNIALPKLPFYQEYAYDEKNHQLVIYEYPAKKAGPLPGQAPR